MKLRIGQPVLASDGPFGVLGEIVVDAAETTVTHIVVRPDASQLQLRLVPIWLVREVDGSLAVDLDAEHLRRLEAPSSLGLVRHDQTINLAAGWDVGTEGVVVVPNVNEELDLQWIDSRVDVAFEPVPRNECEIRSSSEVRTANNRRVGHIHGLISDEDRIVAMVVRTASWGFYSDVLVPLSSVEDRSRLEMDNVATERCAAKTGLEGSGEERDGIHWLARVGRAA